MSSCVILQLVNEETQIETIITQSVTQTRLVNTQWQTQLKDVVVVGNTSIDVVVGGSREGIAGRRRTANSTAL